MAAASVAEATVYSVLYLLAASALVCVACALLLWQRASQTQQRIKTERFVDSRLATASPQVARESNGPAHAQAAMRGAPSVATHRDGAVLPDAALAAGAAFAGTRARPTPVGAQAPASTPVRREGTAAAVARALYVREWRRWIYPLIDRSARAVHRAGIRDIQGFYTRTALVLAGLGLIVGIETNIVASGALLVLLLIGLRVWLWHRAVRQQQRIVAQLPAFLDGVVRMITIGNSVPAAFQAAVPAADQPLRDCLERASRMMRAGLEIDAALNQLGELYRVEEFALIASVVRLSVRYGGRADVVLERMAAFMRDREMAQRELRALSAETRLSAWILGLLPVALCGFIVTRNPSYFLDMWHDPSGRHILFGALGLQLFGAFLLYRLAKF